MFKMKLTSLFGNCQGFCRGKSVFSLICVSKLLPRQNCLNNIYVKIKKLYIYKIWSNSCQKPNSLTKSREVHFSRSNIFLLYFFEKKSLAEVLLTHAEEKWLCRISSFYEKRKTKQLKQNFSKSVGTYGFL